MNHHALLSASGSHKWLNCPPSVRLEEQFPTETSEYAKEGIEAHKLAEAILTGHDYLEDEFTLDVVEDCMGYADFVRERLSIESELLIERRVDFSQYVPEGFGTVDAIIVNPGYFEIIDLKYGQGISVCADNNHQLMLYALGVYSEYGWLHDFQLVKMTIYQPRLSNISTFELPIEDLLAWADSIKEIATLAFEGKGEFNSGKHCQFCRAKYICKARAKKNLELLAYSDSPVPTLTEDYIEAVLLQADDLIKWANSIKDYAFKKAMSGYKYKGFKLVPGKSYRKYKDENLIEEILLAQGYTDLTTKNLLGITDLEKKIGKKAFKELLSKHIGKTEPKPTLVPITDKRREFNSPADDFKDDFKEEE
jgi:CRISPR/Cas system-associated exonuclease Cas4 (RecB family)